MASFSIRVVLHGATAQDFTDLHAKMRALGCSRTITDQATGEVFDLPDGNYQLYSDLTAVSVRELVKRTADSVVRDTTVLVVEALNQVWWLKTPPAQS